MTVIEDVTDQPDVAAASTVTLQQSELPLPPATTTSQHAEIERRARAANELCSCDEKSTFDRVDGDGPDPPFRSADQRFLLYGVSHAGMPPIAKDPTNPGVRFFALLPTREECHDHAAEVQAVDPTCSLLITDTHRWDIAVREPARLTDPHYKEGKIRRIAEAHATLRASNTSEFRSNVKDHKTGGKETTNEETVVSDEMREVRRALHESRWEPLVKNGRRAKTRLPGTLVLDEQRFAVVSFMHDLSPEVVEGDDDPEPAFMVLAAFHSKDECRRYICNVAADHIEDHDMDVVDMCQWLHPETVGLSEQVSTVYRHKELTEIMSQHKKDACDVDRFKQEQEKMGRPVEIKDIGAEGEGQAITFEAELFGAAEAEASSSAWDQVVEAALAGDVADDVAGDDEAAIAAEAAALANEADEAAVEADAAALALEADAAATLTPLPQTVAGLRRLRVGQLRELCEERGLEHSGNKHALVDRLKNENE